MMEDKLKTIKVLKTGVILCLILIPVLVFFALVNFSKPHYYVPVYYGTYDESLGDTVYHTIPDFEFMSQTGEPVTNKDFEGKLYVADYFFTTCLGPCPRMSEQMSLLQKQLKDEDRVMLLSHTVDPGYDNVEVLKAYGEIYDTNPDKWKLVTGSKEDLYRIAREEGYKLAVGTGGGGDGDFIHSQKFVLVDRQRRIRGYYDGTDIKEIERLLNEIGIILREDKLAIPK